jgi:hypothetical protein
MSWPVAFFFFFLAAVVGAEVRGIEKSNSDRSGRGK